jgi:hypothetical protein
MTRTLIFTTLAVLLANSPASARCILSHCQSDTAASSRAYITNTHRQIVGDVYAPRGGQRIQIRDTFRRIIGYIEADGTITNRHRQPVANIEALR